MAKLAIDLVSIVTCKQIREIFIQNREIGRFSLFYKINREISRKIGRLGSYEHSVSCVAVTRGIGMPSQGHGTRDESGTFPFDFLEHVRFTLLSYAHALRPVAFVTADLNTPIC